MKPTRAMVRARRWLDLSDIAARDDLLTAMLQQTHPLRISQDN